MSLVLEGLTWTVGGEAYLHDISAQFDRVGINVLLGGARAGKTSLLRLIAGLEQPTAGSIKLNGRTVTGEPVKKRGVAMVYQEFVNYPILSVYENIASPLRVQRLGRAELDRRVCETAEVLKLEGLLTRRPGELSGGQQQRVAIARALAKRAEVILMDEPLANLDYKLREELRRELPELAAMSSSMVVYATADPMEALMLGGRTATLHEGKMIQFGPAGKIYRRPKNLIAAQIFSDPPLNVLDVDVRGGACSAGNGITIPAGPHMRELAAGRYRLGFRGEQLRLEPLGPGAVALNADITLIEATGAEANVHLSCASQQWVAVTGKDAGGCVPGPATVYLDPAALMVFDTRGKTVALPTA